MLICYPTPLPEDSANALLTRMLTPTSYQVSAEEGENREAGGGLCPKNKSHVVLGETKTFLPEGKGAEEAFHGKKRATSEGQEGKPSKKGKTPSTGGLGRASDVDVELCDEDKPLAKP